MNLPHGIEAALDASIRSGCRLHDGDINEAFRLELSDGRTAFAKTNAHAPPNLFEAEAKGLAWLAEADALRIPEVWAVSGERDADAFLILEYVEPTPQRAADYDEHLGRGLARLHEFGAPSFGLNHDNFIGTLLQINRRHEGWVDFYRSERLEPMLRNAVDRGLLPSSIQTEFDRVFTHLEDRAGDPEPPARLHGDLWAGNVHRDEAGLPTLIDPAVYGGHREVDLAMLQLFGTVSTRTIDAYDEIFPLSPDWRERACLYQLYPLLVHVNLFGSTYVNSLERVLTRC